MQLFVDHVTNAEVPDCVGREALVASHQPWSFSSVNGATSLSQNYVSLQLQTCFFINATLLLNFFKHSPLP
jgi:hypothetical protein